MAWRPSLVIKIWSFSKPRFGSLHSHEYKASHEKLLPVYQCRVVVVEVLLCR